MEPRYTYDEFEEDLSECDGMHIIDGADEVRIKSYHDIEYAVKDGKALHIRMVTPSSLNEEKKYPLIVHIQGSAWAKQNLNCNLGNLIPLVESGFALAIVEYRYAPEYRFPCQIEDGKTAVRYLCAHAEDYSIDLNNIFLSGDSSGGHTSMMMMATWNSKECDAEKTKLPKLRGCIDLYGSLNCLTMGDSPSAYDHDAPDSPASLYLGFQPKTNPEEAYRRSPFFYIDKASILPPLLIMHGSKDRTVPFAQSLKFYQYLRSLGKAAEFYKVKGADHGGNVFYCKAVTDTIIRFLKTNLAQSKE